jgi:hypothetical protein
MTSKSAVNDDYPMVPPNWDLTGVQYGKFLHDHYEEVCKGGYRALNNWSGVKTEVVSGFESARNAIQQLHPYMDVGHANLGKRLIDSLGEYLSNPDDLEIRETALRAYEDWRNASIDKFRISLAIKSDWFASRA